jgi:hypothetical protein
MVGCVLFAFILWGSWYRDAAFNLPSLSASACIWRLPPTSCTMGKMVGKTQKSTPLSTGEKFLFWAIFILIPIYPIYWLISQPILLTIFCAAATAWYLGQWLYFCKRCRVKPCPFNRATATEIVPMQ